MVFLNPHYVYRIIVYHIGVLFLLKFLWNVFMFAGESYVAFKVLA